MPGPSSLARLLLACVALASPAFAAPQRPSDSPDVFGYLRSRILQTDGPLEAGADGRDQLGFLNEARIGLNGELGPADFLVAIDFLEPSRTDADPASEGVELRDLYARAPISDAVDVQVGLFRAPFLFSAQTDFPNTLFPRRSVLGAEWQSRDVGVQLSASGAGAISWKVAAFDSADGDGEDYLLVGRAVYQLSGSEAQREGTQGLSGPNNVAIALSYAEETSVTDGEAFAAEVYGTEGPWYLHAEAVEYGDGFTAGSIASGIASPASGRAGTTPWSATLARAIRADVEIAGRFEDLDDVADTKSWSVGIFKYVAGTHAKWGFSYRDQTSEDKSLEGEAFELALTLIF